MYFKSILITFIKLKIFYTFGSLQYDYEVPCSKHFKLLHIAQCTKLYLHGYICSIFYLPVLKYIL